MSKHKQLQVAKKTQPSFHLVAEQFADNVGIIRAEWYSSSGKLQTICYGTAFAISKRVVLTCAHTIFLEHKSRACTSALFIPKHTSGYLKSNHKIYHSAKDHFLQYQPLGKGQTYLKFPKVQDIALVYLSQDLDMQNFPQVGVKSDKIIKFGSEAQIAGFPSESFFSCKRQHDIFFEKSTLSGRILEIREHIVYHNLSTRAGHSGSAIMASTWDGRIVLIGVHTHKGLSRNSGVYLNKQILKKLADYELYFQQKHSQYQISIKFPQRIQTLEKLGPNQKLKQMNSKQPNLQQHGKQICLESVQLPKQLNMNQKQRDPTSVEVNTGLLDHYYNQDYFQQNCLPDGLINLYFDNIKTLIASPSKWFHPLIITHIDLGNKLLDSLKQIQKTRQQNQANISQITANISKFNGQMNISINKLIQQIKKDGISLKISKFPDVDEHLSILKRIQVQCSTKQSAGYELVPVCIVTKMYNNRQYKQHEQIKHKCQKFLKINENDNLSLDFIGIRKPGIDIDIVYFCIKLQQMGGCAQSQATIPATKNLQTYLDTAERANKKSPNRKVSQNKPKNILELDDNVFFGTKQLHQVLRSEMKQTVHACVGLLLFEHQNSYKPAGRATGFLISEDLVLTCAHYIYDRNVKKCNKNLKFFPGMMGNLQNGIEVSQFYYPQQYENITLNSLEGDYALLKLAQKVIREDYLQLVMQFNSLLCPIEIWGYPENSANPTSKEGPMRVFQKGLSQQKCIKNINISEKFIYHQLSLYSGQSGAPIVLSRNKHNEVIAIQKAGCRAETINAGRLITQDMVNQLQIWRNICKGSSFSYKVIDQRIGEGSYEWDINTPFANYYNFEGAKVERVEGGKNNVNNFYQISSLHAFPKSKKVVLSLRIDKYGSDQSTILFGIVAQHRKRQKFILHEGTVIYTTKNNSKTGFIYVNQQSLEDKQLGSPQLFLPQKKELRMEVDMIQRTVRFRSDHHISQTFNLKGESNEEKFYLSVCTNCPGACLRIQQ